MTHYLFTKKYKTTSLLKNPTTKHPEVKVLIMKFCHEQWLNMSLLYCTKMKLQLPVIAESALLHIPYDEKIIIRHFIILCI